MTAQDGKGGVPPLGTITPDELLVGFASALRAAGLRITSERTFGFVQAVHHVGADDASGVYWAGRATLVRRPEDIPLYDQVFAALWLRQRYEARDEGDVEHLTIATDEED